MSGGGWKKPFEQVAAQDSRNLADFFNKIGFQYGEDEARHNVANPGRAITKAAISAATYGIGDYLAGLYGAGQAVAPAAEVAIPAAEAAIQGGSTMAIDTASEQAIQQALEKAAEESAKQGGQGLLSQAPVTELSSFANTVPVKDLSTQAGLLDKARLALSSGSGAGKGAQQLAMNLGMKAMEPPPQPGIQAAPPRQQGNMEPLPQPYGQNPYGVNGNSMGLLSLEEMKKRQRMGLLR